MNLITHYIVEIHDVVTNKYDSNIVVSVDMTTNSWGHGSRSVHCFLSLDEWESVRVKGQFEA
jgi:ppGpp synthetase/RelA/SpoT-type nucleotidyltranferase